MSHQGQYTAKKEQSSGIIHLQLPNKVKYASSVWKLSLNTEANKNGNGIQPRVLVSDITD